MAFSALRKWLIGDDGRRQFESMGVGVWILDAQHRTEYVNPRMAQILGCSPADMEFAPFLDFVPEDAHASAREYFERCGQAGNEQVDLPLRPRQGTPRWAIVSAQPLPGTAHERPNLLCVVWDITERKKAEKALRKTAAHYRVLADTAEDHIFVIDREDRIEYVNRAAAGQIRRAPEQVIGRRRTEIFPPEIAERQADSLQHVFRTRESHYVEGRTLYRDREVWLGTWLAPITDNTGVVQAVLGVSRDMSAHKRAEDALRTSEQRMRVVLSNIPLVLWATDSHGVVTFCAGRALEPLGATQEDIVGQRFEDLPFSPFPSLKEDLTRVLHGESVNSRIDVRDLTFEAWTVPLLDTGNEITGATGIIVDITERRRLETERSNIQKLEAIGRLAGGIAHDFNNHLTAILGYVEMMLRQSDDSSPLAGDLKEVQHAAERSAGLVRRLLAFGRRQVLQPRNLNLNTLIEEIRPMLERLIGEAIEMDVVLETDLPSVTGDAGELEQVIMNLALNARDAMPAGGTLTIETAHVTPRELRRRALAPGSYVLMTIRDTGEGMDSRVKEHVFEPFFTTKPEGQGTGLGLSTVYGIVKQLNGFIWVDSEVGHGTTFEVYLPVAVHETAPEPVAPAPVVQPTMDRRETILLVEDEHTVRRFAKQALERHGFFVIEAATPEEALTIAGARDQPLSLLLTDVVMPRISGWELADRLKQMRPNLLVLYMSGYPSSLVLQNRTVDPSMRLMSKPFTTAELIATVQETLDTA